MMLVYSAVIFSDYLKKEVFHSNKIYSTTPTMQSLESLKKLVQLIAIQEIMPRFLNTAVQQKPDGSLLSEADIAAQNAFSQRLPEIIAAPVLGEEMSPKAQHELWKNHAKSGLWVLDPIDGTTNFANGLPHFAVSVAFIQQGVAQNWCDLQSCFTRTFFRQTWTRRIFKSNPIATSPIVQSFV